MKTTIGLGIAGSIFAIWMVAGGNYAPDRSTPASPASPAGWNMLDITTGEIVNEGTSFESCMTTKRNWQAAYPDHWLGCTNL